MRVLATEGAAAGAGRNDPCPCGSGRKAKRCHLLPWGEVPDGVPALLGGAARPASKAWDGEYRPAEAVGFWLDAGAGDAIHAVRHVRGTYHRGLGPELSFTVCRPSMARLLRSSFPHMRVYDTTPVPRQDWGVSSLGLIAIASRRKLRGERSPYLFAPSPCALPRDILQVGFCSRGDRTQAFDRWRSVHDVSQLKPLFDAPVRWHLLEPGSPGVPAGCDWQVTANLVAALDLVVSVDTGVAHLAGALGVPVWVMARAPGPGDPGPDDRWDDGLLQDGPLYAGARVFRQDRRGDWAQVARDVARALVRPGAPLPGSRQGVLAALAATRARAS